MLVLMGDLQYRPISRREIPASMVRPAPHHSPYRALDNRARGFPGAHGRRSRYELPRGQVEAPHFAGYVARPGRVRALGLRAGRASA